MGAVSSRLDDSPQIFVRDQSRFALQSIRVTDGQDREVLTITFKDSPTSKVVATSESKRPIEYIQDPERLAAEVPDLLVKLRRVDDLTLHFKGLILGGRNAAESTETKSNSPLTGLTFIHAATQKDAKRLLTADFNADPNLHKLKNVTYVGDYQTGTPFEWNWTWKSIADTSPNTPNGHRAFCAFVEYSQRDNNFIMLAAMSFYVEDFAFSITNPTSPPRRPGKGPYIPDVHENRLESVPENPEMSKSSTNDSSSPPLPTIEPIELSNPRDDEHFLKEIEDGPVFRSRVAALERKTSILKTKTKKCITRADALLEAQNAYFEAGQRWYESLQQLAGSNAKAVQPLLSSYLDASMKESHRFHREKAAHLQYLINELRRIYEHDIKPAETKKRAFEEESQEFYHSMSRYLARTDFPNASKQREKDTKYQTRRREFAMNRFDYWGYINDLTGGKKEGEILQQLCQYMVKKLDTLQEEAKMEKELKPGLDALLVQVEEASREFKLMKTEREQRRRDIEKGKATIAGEHLEGAPSTSVSEGGPSGVETAPVDAAVMSNVGSSVSRGQWLSDVEDEDRLDPTKRKKEGILYALSRPANHNDPKVIPKMTWHKYWVVLDKGQLWEYTNWKRNSELHNESIHLAAANVREAQNAERRFCFELVTPKFKRVYQATSNEDMESWIQAIRNAIESAIDGSGTTLDLLGTKSPPQNFKRHPIGDMFSSKGGKDRRTVSGSQETRELLTGGNERTVTATKTPSILTTIRGIDPSNMTCADCGSTIKTEWCSINLAVILCIECSGIHRSLGSHISKMRSLALDTTSFTSNLVNLLRLLPNAVSNSVWEGVPNPSHPKPTAQSSYETRHAYITAKYVNGKFLESLPVGTSANQYLIGAITHGDLKGVLLALAHKADPNTRAPILPALVVALLQDDKASSGLTKLDSGSSNGSIQQSSSFPFAELLVLNGATPVDAKTLPVEASSLSEAAKRYLQEKLDRTLQSVQSPPQQYVVPLSKGQTFGSTTSASNSSAQTTSGGGTSTSSIGDLNRSMSKLQKRLSSGAKNLRTNKDDG